MNPKLSILIASYNREKYIARAIKSALTQTMDDLEVIVCDDGSKDHSVEVVESFRDPRIRLIRHDTNRGAQVARNIAFRASRGEYIGILDSDDEWDSDLAEKLLSAFPVQNPLVGAIYGGYRTIYENTGCIVNHPINPSRCGDVCANFLSRWPLHWITLIVKRKFLEDVGYFDETILSYQEWDLCIKLSQVCHFAAVNDILATYHIHENNAISLNKLNNAKGYQQIVERYREEILSYCGKHVLARHYAIISRHYGKAENWVLCRKFAKKAITLNPMSLRIIICSLPVIFGNSWAFRLMHRAYRLFREKNLIRNYQ